MSVMKRLIAVVLAALPLGARAAKLTTLHEFQGPGSPANDGALPYGGLIYRDGSLYGTTCCGGTTGYGTVFKLNLKTRAESVLYRFGNGNDGGLPYDTPLYHGGFLYGTTLGAGAGNPRHCHHDLGCGTVFKLDPKTGAETVLHSFAGGADGYMPWAAVVYLGGALYGTTEYGGAAQRGTVFRVDANTGAETLLYSFAKGIDDGANPGAALLYQGGYLYGTTFRGGHAGNGVVFRIDPATGAETILHDFSGKRGAKDGAYPYGPLAYNAGELYGSTYFGGPLSVGTVFKIDIATGAHTVLHRFNRTNGALPTGVIFVNGALYGTTSAGGTGGDGTVFRVDASTGAEKVLYDFTGGTDGGFPYDGLLYQAGAFYGTTYEGGDLNACDGMSCGTVFKLQP